MGPRGLNKFFRTNEPSGIKQIELASFSGKTIVIDASIYLYRFNTNNELIENLYIMINILKKNNIIPLFIFDGIPPPEKFDTLNIRRKDRDAAEKLYDMIMVNNQSNISKSEIEKLKRQKTKVNSHNRHDAKELLEVCGVSYIDAEGEADELCAYCVLNNIAHACLSDDMDLFIYGCPRVLRYFSMMNQTVVYYDFEKILSSLKISLDVFTTITILSGTDYNNQVMSIDILYNEYTKDNTAFIQRINATVTKNKDIQDIKNNYDITNRYFNKVIESRKYFNYNKDKEHKYLSSYNFIFIE